MFIAKNKCGLNVDIDDAIKGEVYFCPRCFQPVLQRRGEINVHHFAHYPISGTRKDRTPCCDTWDGTYDMSEWHRNWQKRFDNSFREKIIEKGNEKHIADICSGNIIVEFQHSPISISNFRKRNTFYNQLGYKVIWVFDLIDEFKNKTLKKWKNKYTWSNVRAPFKSVELNSEGDVLVYIQSVASETERVLERVKGGYKKFSEFYFDENHVLTINRFIELVSKGNKTIFEPRKVKEAPDFMEGGDTISRLWKNNYKKMIVQNLFNKQLAIIIGKDGELMFDKHRSGHIIGKYANHNVFTGKLDVSDDFYIMWDDNKEIWKFIKCTESINKNDEKQNLQKFPIEEPYNKTLDATVNRSSLSNKNAMNEEEKANLKEQVRLLKESELSRKSVILYGKVPNFSVSTSDDEETMAIAEGRAVATLRNILLSTKRSTLLVYDVGESKTYKLNIDRFSNDGYPFEAYLIDDNGEVLSNETIHVRHRYSMRFWKVKN